MTTRLGLPPVTSNLPVAVIGAGPVGLAAAAHLAGRDLPFVVLESGDAVGASMRDWAHVQLFSPWRYTTDTAARALLEPTGWVAPEPGDLPTGGELVEEYLVPLSRHPRIAPYIRLSTGVTGIARSGVGKVTTAGRERAPFVLRLSDGQELLASAVVDASGTWRTPNPLGGTGLPAVGEAEARAAGRVFDGMPDVLGEQRSHFAGRQVAVVGSGHSGIGTLIALAELAEQEPGTTVTWLVRGRGLERGFGGGADDALPARGRLGSRARRLASEGAFAVHTGFHVHEITERAVIAADGTKVEAEMIVNATGARPDFSIAGELRLDFDPVLGSTRELAPLIDPNVHSCGTVPPHGEAQLAHPEPGYYAIGAKSYGRAPTFLLLTGYEQARSVVAALAGDWDAAHDVRLEVPATGVCSTSGGPELEIVGQSSACCG